MNDKDQRSPKALTRREFLKTAAAGVAFTAAGGILMGCAVPPTPQTAEQPATEAPAQPATQAPAQAGGKVKLTYAWPFAAAQPVQSEIVKRFNDQSKTIEVELQIIPQDQVLPKLTTAFSGGAGPDALAMSPAWLSNFAAAGWLENLEDRLSSSGLDKEILPIALIQGRMYKNTAYMAGCVVDTYPLFYNTAMFDEAGLSGPPETIDEFHEYAKQLTDAANNRYGYFQLGGPGWSFQQWSYWMIAQGGIGVDNTLFDGDGKCIFRRPEAVAGLDRWLSLYQVDKVSPEASVSATFNDAANAFNAGQIGMAFGFLGYITNFRDGIGADKFGVAHCPSGPAGEFVHYGCNGFCIGSGSDKKDAAWEFLQFLLTPEINGWLNQEWGAIPSIEKALNEEYLQDPHFEAPKAMVQEVDALVHTPRQLADWGTYFQNYSVEEIQKAMLGQQTAQDFADHNSDFLEEAMAKEA
jgi:multiple sugar transport system substrate-binding protein